MINTILFDFFGTLVHYQPDTAKEKKYDQSYQYLLSQGLKIDYKTLLNVFNETYIELDQHAKKTYHEFHMRDWVNKTFSSLHLSTSQEVKDTFIDIYIDEWNQNVHYIPGVLEMIIFLKSSYNLGIITNTHYPSLIYKHLRSMDLDTHFQTVITSIEFGYRKPDIRIFEFAAKKIKQPRDNILFVGDNKECDYEGANNAGLHSVLISSNENKNIKNNITDILQLRQWLENNRNL